jgi:hypothetical protein
MLWVISLVLLSLWILAIASSYTLGGSVHILIAAAVLVVTYQIIRNRQDNMFKKGTWR